MRAWAASVLARSVVWRDIAFPFLAGAAELGELPAIAARAGVFPSVVVVDRAPVTQVFAGDLVFAALGAKLVVLLRLFHSGLRRFFRKVGPGRRQGEVFVRRTAADWTVFRIVTDSLVVVSPDRFPRIGAAVRAVLDEIVISVLADEVGLVVALGQLAALRAGLAVTLQLLPPDLHPALPLERGESRVVIDGDAAVGAAGRVFRPG